MKILKIITENTVKPFHINAVKRMNKSNINNDYLEMWDFLTNKLFIDDIELKTEIMHLYSKYYDSSLEDIENISNSDLEDLEDIIYVNNDKLALSLFLNIPHNLIVEEYYDHYGLNVYKVLINDDIYAVGDDDEVENAMKIYFEDWVENEGGVKNIKRSLVEDFIELDSSSVSDYARDLAIDRVDQLDEDEVLEEAGYDVESYLDRIEDIEDRISNLEDEISGLEYEQEEDELREQIEDIRNNIESLKGEKLKISSEMKGLYEDAKEELIETYERDIVDDIDYRGLDYFLDMGYNIENSVKYFFYFDEQGLESYLVQTEDRGNTLATYSGREDEQVYDDKYYYIYRVD